MKVWSAHLRGHGYLPDVTADGGRDALRQSEHEAAKVLVRKGLDHGGLTVKCGEEEMTTTIETGRGCGNLGQDQPDVEQLGYVDSTKPVPHEFQKSAGTLADYIKDLMNYPTRDVLSDAIVHDEVEFERAHVQAAVDSFARDPHVDSLPLAPVSGRGKRVPLGTWLSGIHSMPYWLSEAIQKKALGRASIREFRVHGMSAEVLVRSIDGNDQIFVFHMPMNLIDRIQ